MKYFNPSFSELQIDRAEILLNLGYGGNTPDEQIVAELEQIIAHANEICLPRAAYRICNGQSASKHFIEIDAIPMKVGSIIAGYLEKATHFGVFVATAGSEYDDYLHQLKAEGDIVKEFLADAVGSEIAEATVRYVTAKIEEDAQQNGYAITHSYSPGYCGWHVREQQALFSIFPLQPCGIQLNDSSLMHPVKSVSGIVGLGVEIIQSPYACDICGLQSCYKRKETLNFLK
jgi:hypothetical protein